jgi:hypothetical protein
VWEESVALSGENQVTTRNLQGEPNEAGTRAGVQVTAVGAPQKNASEMTDIVTQAIGSVHSVEDVEKREITWPGAESAWFVTFVARLTSVRGEQAAHLSECLILDLADGTQRQVTVTAPVAEFETLRMREILASVSVV